MRSVYRHPVWLLVLGLSVHYGCVEKRLPTQTVDGQPPYDRVLLNPAGMTADWATYADTFPSPGKVSVKIERMTGSLGSVRFEAKTSANCQELDRISQERVTTIERSPKQALIAPTLLGAVGAVAGLGWSIYGLSQYAELPPPTIAASSRENRQNQLTQVTLPLTTLGISLALLAIPAFASIDGEERARHGDRLGGRKAWTPCSSQAVPVSLQVASGMFHQPITNVETTLEDQGIDIASANVSGAIERLVSLKKICVDNCPTGPRTYRPLSVDERRDRIQKARKSVTAFLEALKTSLRGRVARRSKPHAAALAETNRVILRMNRSQQVDLSSLSRLLKSAGDAEQAETASQLAAAYREALPKKGIAQQARGPQYLHLRPIDRLIASPWTCVTGRGLNPFATSFVSQGVDGSISITDGDEFCIDWSKYGPAVQKVRTARRAAAHAVLQDSLPHGAPLVTLALKGELPLQKESTTKERLATRAEIVRAIRGAAADLRVPLGADTSDTAIAAIVATIAWNKAVATRTVAAVKAYLKVYDAKDAPYRAEAQALLTELQATEAAQ